MASIETGCYDWDEDVYCIGSGDINDSVFDDLFPEHDLVSVLTMIDGRGVNLGNTNIQEIKPRTEYTLMHELGHAHGEMGDEYITSDDRDVSAFADRNVNTTTQSDPSLLKWKHHIEDLLNVPGKDFKVCYNYADGTIYDEGEDLTTCDCLFNLYDESGNRTGRNPECNSVGLFEGNYYGEFDNFRPKYWTIMEGGILSYGEVNSEGFAIGSIHNQGFLDGDEVGFIQDASGTNTGFEIDIDVAYDTSKLKLQWYVDGVLDSSKNPEGTPELFHGYTYSGHPVACAAALATLDIYKEEGLFDNAAHIAPVIEEAAHSLKGTKHIIDIRNLGVIAALELEPKKGAVGVRGFETMKKAWDLGLMVRANGDTLAFSPPLIINDSQVDEMFTKVKKALEHVD